MSHARITSIADRPKSTVNLAFSSAHGKRTYRTPCCLYLTRGGLGCRCVMNWQLSK
jgi:hypothetical protein